MLFYQNLKQQVMKKITSIIAIAVAMFLLAGGVLAQPKKASLTGVWKYELDGWEGMCIFSPTHFIWVLTDKNRQPFTNPTPTISQKAIAYEAINAAAGTWELESDSRGKNTLLYTSNPHLKGNFVRYDFELVGNEFNYWVIQPDGSRGASGKCRKLADWNAQGDISIFNGVWEYIGLNGLYFQSGNYGAWFILNGAQSDISGEEGKAKNFDAVNSSMVFATRLKGNQDVWNVVYSADVRNEKESYFTDSEVKNSDLFGIWFIDAKGAQVGGKWQVKRIGR
jgi:hypothetical protein